MTPYKPFNGLTLMPGAANPGGQNTAFFNDPLTGRKYLGYGAGAVAPPGWDPEQGYGFNPWVGQSWSDFGGKVGMSNSSRNVFNASGDIIGEYDTGEGGQRYYLTEPDSTVSMRAPAKDESSLASAWEAYGPLILAAGGGALAGGAFGGLGEVAGAANTFGLEAGAGLGTGGGYTSSLASGLATTGGSAAGGGEMIFPDILDIEGGFGFDQGTQNLLDSGGIDWSGGNSPNFFDDALVPGSTAPAPTVSVPGYGDIYGSPASILKSITQGGLPANLLKSIMGGSGASGGAGGSSGGTGMGWLDDILKGLGGPAGVLGKGIATTGILAAMEDAKSGGQIDTSRLESSFDRFDPASLTGAYDMASGAGRTELATSLARRGVSGSSFGNADLSNYDMTRDVGRQTLLGQGVATQADIANKILQAQIAAKKNQNDLYGRSLLALGSVFQPKSQFSVGP